MKYPYENLENFTLKSLINRSTQMYASEAVVSKMGQEPITYKEFEEQMHTIVNLLINNGIKKGDKVAMLSENMPHWTIAYFAVTYFGAVIVPILPDFHKSDVHHI